MRIREDFHVHSSYSDGKHTPEEIAARAVSLGLGRLGFSDHGFAPYDLECCIPENRLEAHRADIRALKEQYRGKLEIFCGIEQDCFSETPTEEYDYVIGSVHYLRNGEAPVDDTPEKLEAAAQRFYGGDIYALAEDYFRLVGEVYDRTRCDIVGHFDLVSKFHEKHPLFDTAHPRYIAAWKAAADRLLAAGVPFEINTGAMSRLWRTSPYPAGEIQDYLSDRGAAFVLSSDSHSADTLCFAFGTVERDARKRGLRLVHFMPGRNLT